MGKVLRRRWEARFDETSLPRRDRTGCVYEAFVPDPLIGRSMRLRAETAADVADAERAVLRFDARASVLTEMDALARLLLRAESVASSFIEGLEIGAERLLRADHAQGLGEPVTDVTAVEVLGAIEAAAFAARSIDVGTPIAAGMLLEAHERLFRGTPFASHAGRLRTEQNWIGGSSYNPCTAAFVPPPPEMVPELIADLCAFCNGDDLPAVAQAAVAHAQFETIHPFADGNGRIGRILVHAILRRRGLAQRTAPPISLILAIESDAYVEGLTGTRVVGSPTSAAAADGLDRWIAFFATTTRRAADDAAAFEDRILALQADWRARLGAVRAGSSLELLLRALPGMPIFTVATASATLRRSEQAVNEATSRLSAAGIVHASDARRNRRFEATEIIDAFTDLERRFASPARDTRIAPPARRVPYRPGARKRPRFEK